MRLRGNTPNWSKLVCLSQEASSNSSFSLSPEFVTSGSKARSTPTSWKFSSFMGISTGCSDLRVIIHIMACGWCHHCCLFDLPIFWWIRLAYTIVPHFCFVISAVFPIWIFYWMCVSSCLILMAIVYFARNDDYIMINDQYWMRFDQHI